MSDTQFPGAANDAFPGSAGGGAQDSGGGTTPGQLAVAPLAAYIVTYTGDTLFRLGSNGPFEFRIRRADQSAVGIPVISQCTIVLPSGGTTDADLTNPSAPADTSLPLVAAGAEAGTILPVYVLYKLQQIGDYRIRLELEWDGVFASTPQEIRITCSL